MMRKTIMFFLTSLYFKSCHFTVISNAKCVGRHKYDIGVYYPMLLQIDDTREQNGNPEIRIHAIPPYLSRDYADYFEVQHDETIIVACPGNNVIKKLTRTQLARLESGQQVRWTVDQTVEMEPNQNSFFATCRNGEMETNVNGRNIRFPFDLLVCNDHSREVEIDCDRDQGSAFCRYYTCYYGYTISFNNIESFIWKTFEYCYNFEYDSTLYAIHTWRNGSHLGRKNIDWEEIIACGISEREFYHKHRAIFQIGHLIPDADVLPYQLKELTYSFLNAAPQVSQFNGGKWSRLENGIRANYLEARIITGTSCGETNLFYEGQNDADEYFLTTREPRDEANTKRLIRIPRFFWKIVTGTTITGECSSKIFIGLNWYHESSFQWYSQTAVNLIEQYRCTTGPIQIDGIFCPPEGSHILQFFPEIRYVLEVYLSLN